MGLPFSPDMDQASVELNGKATRYEALTHRQLQLLLISLNG
jgi:hypothetical protein